MLNIAFDELPRRRAQKMSARDRGAYHAKRKHVLDLIAESVGAACLVEARASPDSASESLIGKPAIQEKVQRPVWRPDLHRAEHVVPLLDHFGKDRVEIGCAVFGDKELCFGSRRSLPKKQCDLRGCACAEP